jgi:hypothetical protein
VCITQLRSIFRLKCGRVWVSPGVQLQPGETEKGGKMGVLHRNRSGKKGQKKTLGKNPRA